MHSLNPTVLHGTEEHRAHKVGAPIQGRGYPPVDATPGTPTVVVEILAQFVGDETCCVTINSRGLSELVDRPMKSQQARYGSLERSP